MTPLMGMIYLFYFIYDSVKSHIFRKVALSFGWIPCLEYLYYAIFLHSFSLKVFFCFVLVFVCVFAFAFCFYCCFDF